MHQKNSDQQKDEINQQMEHLREQLEHQKLENQKLRTDLAVMQERFDKREEAYIYAKKQDDTQLQHFLQEKGALPAFVLLNNSEKLIKYNQL